MKEEYKKMLGFIGLCCLCELVLDILIFVYLPKTKHYENDLNLDEPIKYNQTILGFAIALFIFTFFFLLMSCLACCTGQNEEGTVCFCHLLIVIYLKLISTFVEWSISLALITFINKIQKQYKDEGRYHTQDIKSKIIKVVIFITLNFLLNIIEVVLASCVYEYQCFEGFNVYDVGPSSNPNSANTNDRNNAGKNTAVVVARIDNNVIIGHIESV